MRLALSAAFTLVFALAWVGRRQLRTVDTRARKPLTWGILLTLASALLLTVGEAGADPSSLVAVNSDWASDNTGTDRREDVSKALATDGAGNWVAAWTGHFTGQAPPTTDLFVARSADNGASWAPVQRLTSDAAWDDGPHLATDGTTWLLTWVRQGITGDPLGTDRDIVVSRSTDAGGTWTAPAPLNSDAASDTLPDEGPPKLTTDGNGHWVAVWTTAVFGNDPDVAVSRSSDGGVTWSPKAPLNSYAGSDNGLFGTLDYSPVVTTDGAGTWVAAWASEPNISGADWDIRTARSLDNGETWSSATWLNTNAASDSSQDERPALAAGGGAFVALWTGLLSGNNLDIIYSRSADGGVTWAPAATFNPDAASDSVHDYQPVIASGGGVLVAAWATESQPLSGDYPGLLYTMRSADGGLAWTPTVRIGQGTPGNTRLYWPAVAVDSSGTSVDIWSAWDGMGTVAPEDDTDADVYSAHCHWADLDCDGTPDAADNCASLANPGQENADGDDWGDACDYCPATATMWVTPAGDEDCDGFASTIETSIGTDPADNCPNGPGHDAWPLDNNVSGSANVSDVLAYKGLMPGAVDPSHPKRLDLDDNNSLNVSDVLKFKGKMPGMCS